MSQLRWHPFLQQWVVVAAHRQGRPQMPENWCPFCPGSGNVPAAYDVYLYPNDFPAFGGDEPFHPGTATEIGVATGAPGACDVVLYSPDHYLQPSQLPIEQWSKVIDLWTRRSSELWAKPEIEYVSIFENTGVAIGVTMPHPHGQIYAFPFVPPMPAQELQGAKESRDKSGECLHCRVLKAERSEPIRVIAENDGFTAFVPFYGRFPTEVHIYSRRHFATLANMSGDEAKQLAEMISVVRRKYDNLYGFPMPLMMVVRQSPVHGDHPYFHFHIQLLPIQRSATKLKYLAAVESGNGTFLNDTRPEEQGERLRAMPPSLGR